MYIIVGLGNPGTQYEKTRHNVGFQVIDVLAEKAGIRVESAEHKALVGKGILNGQKVILVKPQTFMNLSGESVRALTDYYKVNPSSELIVISDDIALNVGQLRVRKKGSAGGHNGLKNIILHLGREDFVRIRVGVGDRDPQRADLVHHVLGHFEGDDIAVMKAAEEEAAEAVLVCMQDGPDEAMNRFNRKKTEE